MAAPAPFLQWAHQGGAREGPSNTLHAMRKAVHEVGANALEFDVHLTRDKALVVAHDRKLGRISEGSGRISRMTLAELQDVDAAYWWVPGTLQDHAASAYPLRGRYVDDPALRLPTVEQVLDEFPDVALTIEVKAMRAAKPLVDLLRRRGRANVTVTAFFDYRLWPIRRTKPPVDLAPALGYLAWFRFRLLLRLPPRRSPYQRIQVPIKIWGVTFLDVKGRFLRAARRAGLQVDAWTIDDPAVMTRLIDDGVDGIMTDTPSVLAAVVGT
ncbi:MAG TPA: glycerophosphodiester phosphodiesterase family protein [Acidimicrobiales bacterium]|nr:glycerophosphodiester phosphodiesterase family protein [Acidimicrobiales bacterium]